MKKLMKPTLNTITTILERRKHTQNRMEQTAKKGNIMHCGMTADICALSVHRISYCALQVTKSVDGSHESYL